MTADEARANQERIAETFDLGWWYGVRCEKCCGVFPRLIVPDGTTGRCYYRCEVCGRRTAECEMPWIAEEKWNNHEWTDEGQFSLF